MERRAAMPFFFAVSFFLSVAVLADDEDARGLFIQHSQAGLIIRGDSSSAGHEQILRRTAAERFPDSDRQFNLVVRPGLPVAWSLITDLTLRAVAKTNSGGAEMTPQRIAIRGFAADSTAWNEALDHLKRQLPQETLLDVSVVTLDNRQSFDSMCRQLFAAAFRAHKIEFALRSTVLRSSAYGLLDEITELGLDCPAASIRITGNGDGGVTNQKTGLQRANAVVSYLKERGFDPVRLRALGAEESVNRRILFSVSF